MRFSSTAISSVASYTKMSDTSVSSPESPTTSNKSNAKKFEGDGVSFKGKLIGVDELSIDRDEKICLDSMFKLKAVVRARGEHKQKIQLNLTMSSVKVIDDTTKAPIASHEIERISFVVIDPRDTRAFGYIFNTADDRHQFWAIKTERAAAASVVALKELFEVAFEQFTNTEKEKLEANKSKPTTTTTTPPPPSISSSNEPVTTPESSSVTTVSALPPAPSPPPPPVSAPVVPTTTSSPMDDDIWVATPTLTTTQPLVPINGDLWDINAPPIPVKPPAPKIIDPLEEIFGELSTTNTQPSTTTNSVLNFIPNSAPPPANPFTNFPPPPQAPTAQTNPFNATPQQPYTSRTVPLLPQQQDLLAPRSFSPVAPPFVTNPFSEFDILGDLSSGTASRPTKESFFPTGPPPKTIQQLQMEKQLNRFTRS